MPDATAVGVLLDVRQRLLIMTGLLERAEIALLDGDLSIAHACIRLATQAALQATASCNRLTSAGVGQPGTRQPGTGAGR